MVYEWAVSFSERLRFGETLRVIALCKFVFTRKCEHNVNRLGFCFVLFLHLFGFVRQIGISVASKKKKLK